MALITYNVKIEPEAQEDLFSIVDYISQILHEPVVAANIYQRIKEQISLLSDMPKRHKLIDIEPYCSIGVRTLLVKNYTVYYNVDDDKRTVHIIRVLYNRREWQDIL
ncbi:type II toxin-antitoxin system RelE/ParE family toxin [uncultured Ruminococcus sp.]|uniref:type II toxin-antitoxin system RelE/ParE family toxin n=1 Tax=uncultured Ruminococcus sp. TaxID=165186 RepID=UPI00292FD9AD|nr:type II toxin-antitoxin system RelE/ParE family toxin [uncultured Ruminococcus sp.]